MDSKQAKCLIEEALPELAIRFLERFRQSYRYKSLPERYKPDFEDYYKDHLDRYLQRHLKKYKLPERQRENFDPVTDFYFRFLRNIESYVSLRALRDLGKLRKTTPIDDLSEKEIEKLNLRRYQEGEDMEQRVLNSLMQERIDNLNREFQKHLNTLEKKVFRGMLDGLTVN